MYTQGFCLLTWLCFLGEIPVRALYLDRTRLRYGVNLPSETVDSIARGIAVPPSSRQNGIILECSIGRFRELESELSWRKYSTVIKNICSIISSSAEKHGGMESCFGEGMFRYCFLSHTGNTDEVVGRAVAAAKEMEKNFREYLLTINRKKNIPLTFSAALTSGKGTPLRTPQKGRSRIVFVSKENDILPELVSLNREYGSSIIITEDIFLILGDNNDVRLLDRVRLPKSRITVTVLQIINSSAPDVHRLLEMYNTARLQFYAKQFDDARILFRKIIREFPDDGPSRVFHKRCLYYLKNSVPLQRTVDFSR